MKSRLPTPELERDLGMVIGGLTSLVAFGLALVYRANRIVNFAQGDLLALNATRNLERLAIPADDAKGAGSARHVSRSVAGDRGASAASR